MIKFLITLLALALAGLAQICLFQDSHPGYALILYPLAGALFVYGAHRVEREREPEPPPAALPRWSMCAGLGAVLLSVGAAFLFWQDSSSLPGLGLWSMSLPLLLAAVWPLKIASRKRPAGRGDLNRYYLEFGLLLIIVLAGFFLRTYRLDAIPNGCQSDECNNGLDALKWLSGAPYTPYAETNEGQATLFTYGLALFFKLFGASVPTMRLLSAVVGVCTIVAFYFLARYLFEVRTALVGAALLAASRWHITFSRIIYEAIMVPLFEILAFYFLWRGLREGRGRYYVLAGISLGLGLHTYTAFRVVPLAVVVFCLYWLIRHRRSLRRYLAGLALCVLSATMTVMPLVIHVLQHLKLFLRRIRHISIQSDIEAAGSLAPLGDNLRKYLLMFNYQGDAGALNNLPNAPLLDFVVAVLFVLGLAYALYGWRQPKHFLFLTWLVVVLQAGVFSIAHEAPSARRTIGLIPVVYLLACTALDGLGSVFQRTFQRWGQSSLTVALGAVTILVSFVNYDAYFNVQARHRSVWIAYSAYEAAIGEYIASLEDHYRIYLAPSFCGHSAIEFIAQRPSYIPLNLSQHLPLREEVDHDVVYILDEMSARLRPVFEGCYPEGRWEEHRDPFGRLLFSTYTVSAAGLVAVRGLIGHYYPNDRWQEPTAFERQDEALAFDWQTDPPLSPPFSVEWEGSLFVPRHGRYVFELEAEGEAALTIDDQTVIDNRNQVFDHKPGFSGERLLVRGFHALKVQYKCTPQNGGGRLRLLWSGANLDKEVIPPQALYTLPVPANGLMGYYFRGTDWQGRPALVQMDHFILPNDPLPTPFSIEWRGVIEIPETGLYTFATYSDDGSYLYIDDQMVVDNGGSHGAVYREGQIELSAGEHDILVRYFQAGGSREMELWWTPPGGGRELLPQEVLYPRIDESALELALEEQPQPPDVKLFPLVAAWDQAKLQEPRGVAIDKEGRVYIADVQEPAIYVFDEQGHLLDHWSDPALQQPFDLAVDEDGDVYVLDSLAGSVLRFSPDGRLKGKAGESVSLYSPRGLALDARGNLYVADTGHNRVVKLSSKGHLLYQFSRAGRQPMEMNQPTDVAVDEEGYLYVVDTLNERVQKWTTEGYYAGYWPIPLADTYDSPRLALGRDVVYVTDPQGKRVLVYDRDGQPLGQWGEGRFERPSGIAVDAKGHIYVTDVLTGSVQVFAPVDE